MNDHSPDPAARPIRCRFIVARILVLLAVSSSQAFGSSASNDICETAITLTSGTPVWVDTTEATYAGETMSACGFLGKGSLVQFHACGHRSLPHQDLS